MWSFKHEQIKIMIIPFQKCTNKIVVWYQFTCRWAITCIAFLLSDHKGSVSSIIGTSTVKVISKNLLTCTWNVYIYKIK